VGHPGAELHAVPEPERYLLILFVVGGSERSRRAVANLRSICEELLQGRYLLEVIDLREFPKLAGDRDILAAPTLIRERPEPVMRLIGDMSHRDRVLAALGLD
jgi:circadian clock protein KaiB